MFKTQSQIELNLQEMKHRIMNQIDKTIQESPLKSRTNLSQISDNLRKNAASTTNVNEKVSERKNINNQKISYSKKQNAVRSDLEEERAANNLKFLKNQILEQEKLQDENNHLFKNKCNLLNDEIDEMRQKLFLVQEQMRTKDRIIADYEYKMGSMLNSKYNSQLYCETLHEKAQEDIQNNILHLKNKLSLKKAQIAELKDEIKRIKIEQQEEMRRNIDQKSYYESALNQFKEKSEQEKLRSLETERLLDKTRTEIENRDAMTERLQSNTSVQVHIYHRIKLFICNNYRIRHWEIFGIV